ncbi:multiple sugar transport system permease protein [Caldalkalibacillus uzonensis]|uniref:Multiple sugar transport system permease protein n=1 Tax=Caldalkalibacillus uzonensis TaxID=353224 RepID=A0ABU0CQH2_9BACI|nr:carbohydrate ABC transporter permease [Caldalkalibacillus uzonensis]MDQ0338664.1 multiple sugar transport system permease protein [Caldalkalibacillus uzonensis]
MFNIRWSKIAIYSVLILGSVIVMYPFFIMVMNSFKPGTEIMHYPLSLPQNWTISGYVKVFTTLNMGVLFKNSLIISVSVTILNVILNAMVAYALAKLHFPGRDIIFKVVLGSMMIPAILLLIPTYTMLYNWGWVNTYRVMIIPVAVSAYNIFLIRQFLIQIPNDYLEAARMDGCNEIQVFYKIVLPMIKPVLATVGILTFMHSWNDLFMALLYLRDESMYTLQLGLYQFKEVIPGRFLEQLWAATTLVTVPVVIVFFFLQRYFIEAFTGVGLK